MTKAELQDKVKELEAKIIELEAIKPCECPDPDQECQPMTEDVEDFFKDVEINMEVSENKFVEKVFLTLLRSENSVNLTSKRVIALKTNAELIVDTFRRG